MKKIFVTLALVFSIPSFGFGQTCTIDALLNTNVNWTNPGPACVEGGNAGSASTIVIPATVTLTFNDAADTWTGSRIEVNGILKVSAGGPVNINTSVTVKFGAIFRVDSDASLGTTSGCGYSVLVETGGKIDLHPGKTLSICGTPVLKNGPTCYPYVEGGQLPYCEPTDGFTGPVGFDENGINNTLPIVLSSFDVEEQNGHAILKWTTTMEENFEKFIVQRSVSGVDFEDVGQVAGKGFNLYDIESRYRFEDNAPLLGMNYYRLKAVDLDGSFEYFQVKAIKVSGSKKVEVYPNPSAGDKIFFQINFSPSELDRIVLLDQLGVEVYNALAGTSGNAISLPEVLPAGVYLLRYVSGDVQQTVKLLVK